MIPLSVLWPFYMYVLCTHGNKQLRRADQIEKRNNSQLLYKTELNIEYTRQNIPRGPRWKCMLVFCFACQQKEGQRCQISSHHLCFQWRYCEPIKKNEWVLDILFWKGDKLRLISIHFYRHIFLSVFEYNKSPSRTSCTYLRLSVIWSIPPSPHRHSGWHL